MADATPTSGDKPGADEPTVTVRELQERSNRSSWRIVSIGVAVIVAVFVLLGIALWNSQSARDELTNKPVSSTGTSQPGSALGPGV